MNYKILQKLKKNWGKAVKSLSIFFAVFLVLTIIFYSPQSSSTIPDSCTVVPSPNPGVNCLPNCNTLDVAVAADPGVNCLYLDLPICTSTNHATSTITNPDPRINCADVIDLPLCSDVNSPTTPQELKNCVPECATIADTTGSRGVDYAVHNKNCIRFCGNTLSNGNTNNENLSSASYMALSDAQKCVARKCHQDINGYVEGGYNCNLQSCKLLTIDELNEAKFANNADKKYCDGSEKCYNFSQDKFPYLISGRTCQIHTCSPQPQPASSSCTDEANDIIAKGNSFTQDYIRYIIQPKESDGTTDQAPATLSPPNNTAVKDQLMQSCTPSNETCLPLTQRQFRCNELTEDEDPPTKPNVNCDTGATCDSNGFCNKTIDCNTSPSEPECLQPSYTDPEESPDDPIDDSWFYNPSPMDKSINSNHQLITMSPDLCYTTDQMKDHGWGKDVKIKVLGITVPLGYFHSQFQPDRTRSPGKCNTPKSAGRGTGYLYLCGNEGNANAKVSQWTAYNSSISSTTFTNTDSTTKVKVCLRFKNAFRPMDTVSNSETCGKRECAISCAFDLCESQLCGDDVCKTLTVKESKATDCIMDNDMFTNANGGRDCASIIDNTLRVRAVQYSNRVCTFLDAYDHLAYNKMFMNGKETLSDGTCLTKTDTDGKCNGQDSNANKTLITFWRAVMLIKYITDNRGTDPRGYIKKNGQLVKEQDCIKIPLRVRTPRLYNLVTKDNAFKLFTPPVYISKSYAADGSSSTSESGTFGPTDFNYPKIEITYGEDTKYVLSLDINKTGYETENKDPNASKSDITTIFNDYTYTTSVSIKKDFNSETLTPTLCLYQTITDTNGNPQTIKLECIDRTLPEINNDPFGTPTRKVIITAPTTNTYYNAQISLKYQGPNASNLSNEILLGNVIQSTPECKSDVENYKICAQREECNMLNNEFVINEINIQNNTPPVGQDMNSMLAMRNYFNSTLIPTCDQKSGKIGTYIDHNAYGWFDEICISSGFETKLKDIVAYKVFDANHNEVPSITGKCVIDLVHSTGSCLNGGKPPECICQDATGVVLDPSNVNDAKKVIRKQTPREAGLCINLPTPNQCLPITYNTDAARTAGTNTGNADFATYAYGGMNNVLGQCVGNWKNSQVNGVDVPPMMNCVKNNDNTVSWSYIVTNPCVRYSCPTITTQPSAASGVINYTNYYTTANETTDLNKGQSNGYATWNSKTSNDNSQTASAISCITGFAKNNTFPTRECSPKGIWQNVANACIRKTCPALNFVSNATFDSTQWNADWNASSNNPANANSDTQEYNIWSSWDQYGGASFVQTNASRVDISSPTDGIATESIAVGTCNTHLGYFPLGAGPTMKCDQNGNWVYLENRCVTSCDAVVNGGSNDGNASWNAETVPNNQDYTIVSATSCNTGSGYFAYPYSTPKDVDGNYINYTADPNDSSKKVYASATPLATPQRKCQNSNIVIGNTIVKAAVWKDVYPACTNKCPGAATDPRVGVGITKHQLSNGDYVYLEWPDLLPNQSYVIYSSSSPQTVADYSPFPNHSSGVYAVKRTCGADYKWQTYIVNGVTEYVVPQCSSRNGTINNTNTTSSSITDTIDENSSLATVGCNSGYATRTNVPQYTCSAKDASRYIDQFYYTKSGGGDCVKTCDIPTSGTSFGSGSEYVSGASGTKFEGDTITLACRSNFGKRADNDLSTSDSNCGISNSSRSNISPTTSCLSTGQWSTSITNDCTACASCTCSSGNCGSAPYPFIRSTSDQTKVKLCSYADNSGNNTDDVFLAGPYTRSDVDCGNSGDSQHNLYPGTVESGSSNAVARNGHDNNSVTYTFTCYDGLFVVTQTNQGGNTSNLHVINY